MESEHSKFEGSGNELETDPLLPSRLKKHHKSSIIRLSVSQHDESIGISDSIKYKINEKWVGLFCAFGAATINAIVTVLLKYLQSYDTFVITFWKSIGVTIFSILLFMKSLEGRNIESMIEPIVPSSEKKWTSFWTLFLLLIRGTTGLSTVAFTFLALHYISMGDSGVIGNAHPILVLLFSLCCFDEKCGVIPILACVASVFGVIIISKPPFLSGEENFQWESMIGIFFSFMCALSYGVKFVTLRGLRHLDYSLVQTINGGVGIIESIFLILIFTSSSVFMLKTFKDWCFIIGLSLAEFLGGVMITIALKFEDASVVSFIQTFSVILLYIFQVLLFRDIPDILSIIGAFLIISSVILAIGSKIWTEELNKLSKKVKLYFNV